MHVPFITVITYTLVKIKHLYVKLYHIIIAYVIASLLMTKVTSKDTSSSNFALKSS